MTELYDLIVGLNGNEICFMLLVKTSGFDKGIKYRLDSVTSAGNDFVLSFDINDKNNFEFYLSRDKFKLSI